MKKNIISVLFLVLLVLLAGCEMKEDSEKTGETGEEDAVSETEENPQLNDVSLSDFVFAFDGITYQVPVAVQEMQENGWIYDGDLNQQLAADTSLEEQGMLYEGQSYSCDITNFTNVTSTVKESYVSRIELRKTKAAMQTFYLPGGIVAGESTEVDVTRTYGEARDRYEGKKYILLTYSFGSNAKVVLTFRQDTEVLVQAELTHSESSEEAQRKKEADTAETDAVKAYSIPTEAGETPEDKIVKFGDDFYRIPAPVSAFLENGWELDETSSDAALEGGQYGYVTMKKDNQQIYTTVQNPDENLTVINNCFVTSLYGDLTTTKIPIVTAFGLRLGMDTESFLAAIGDTKWTREKDEEARTECWTYEITKEEENDREDGSAAESVAEEEADGIIKVTIDLDLLLISAIEVH